MIKVIPTQEPEEYQVGNLRVMRGGKGPPLGGGINWLNGLEKGTAFTCKRKGNSDTLDFFVIAFKYDRSIILVSALDNNQRFVVDPEDFCKKYSFHELIAKEEAQQEPEGVSDGNGTQVRSGGVVDDEDAPSGQPRDEGNL